MLCRSVEMVEMLCWSVEMGMESQYQLIRDNIVTKNRTSPHPQPVCQPMNTVLRQRGVGGSGGGGEVSWCEAGAQSSILAGTPVGQIPPHWLVVRELILLHMPRSVMDEWMDGQSILMSLTIFDWIKFSLSPWFLLSLNISSYSGLLASRYRHTFFVLGSSFGAMGRGKWE